MSNSPILNRAIRKPPEPKKPGLLDQVLGLIESIAPRVLALEARAPVAGPQGERGEIGMSGPRGEDGKPGIEGKAGRDGDRGEPGPQGPQGLEGPKGLQGDRGDVGPQGPQGEKGERGEKGEPGDVAELGYAPDDIADLISQASILIAQTPTEIVAKMSAPIINITNVLPEAPKPTNKIIKSVRDKDGNLNTTVIEKPIDED